MSQPTAEQAAQGWRNFSTLPIDGELVDVLGSDFMGDWQSVAFFRVVSPKGPKWKLIGSGFMGPRKRDLEKGDVDFWRPSKQKETPDDRSH